MKKSGRKIKGFTLIELLAVIIIIGVLMIIVVPSVTEYIVSSRKNTYVTTAERYINGVRQMVASKQLSMKNTDTTYYVPFECIKTDSKGESPYGEWKRAYVAVTFKDDVYNYYWTSTDEANMGILLAHTSKLSPDSIRNNIIDVGTNIGVGDRDKILVIDGEKCSVKDAEMFSPEKRIEEKGEYIEESEIVAGPGTMRFSVAPSGWAHSKTIAITYPSGYVNEYSLDYGKTWKRYTNTITVTENKTVIARISDGAYYVNSVSQTITGIDRTIPTSANFTTTATSSSITVVATGEDLESGIAAYSFSKDDGETWTTAQTSSMYTFTGLKTGTYKIKVRVVNGTYVNEGLKDNYLDSDTKEVETIKIDKPTYLVTPDGWAQNKNVIITYPEGYTGEYSIDGGLTFTRYTSDVVLNQNGSVIARVTDGINYVTAATLTVAGIDTTVPTKADFTTEVTSRSITVTATGEDLESGIARYRFSKDDGASWTELQESEVYTFENLTTGTYKIKVRVVNGTYENNGENTNNYLDSDTKSTPTEEIAKPTYGVTPSGWAQSKTIAITYPSGYNNEYSIDGGNNWIPYTNPITFTANGNIIARVNDGLNYVTSTSQTVTGIDTTKPTAATLTTTITSNSITVTAYGTDNESEIVRYRFSKDGGASWTELQTSQTYTFTGLTTGDYNIKVRVVNGTYVNNLENDKNYLESDTKVVSTSTIPKPTYSVSPSGWSQNKTITITYPSGYNNEYSVDDGMTWKSYTAPVTLTANGNIIARVNDGINYVSAASQTVTGIDTSRPTAASFTTEVTSNSIKVTAAGTDPESEIVRYRFSKDNGATWTSIQNTKTYTFTGLTTGTYNIKVRVINGTYGNTGENTNSYLDSSAIATATTEIAKPTYGVSPSGWSQSKTVTITYPSGYTKEYSTDGGSTWKSYTGAVTFTANGTIIGRVTDGTNYVSGTSQSVTSIDTSKPTAASVSTTVTSNSIKVTASGTDSQSNIVRYRFSKDNGATWTAAQTSNVYTYSGLTTGTYNIKVRVINGTYVNNGENTNNYLDSAASAVKTTEIAKPTYSVSPSGWSQSKSVTITYPSGYTNEYSTDGGMTWKSYTGAVTFTANGTIVGRVTDGTNYVSGTSQSVTSIDTSKPTAASFSTTTTSKSITVIATGTDSQSNIVRYRFSNDNGANWTASQTSNTYTFNNLTTGSYNIKVRVINGTFANNGENTNSYLDSAVKSVATATIAKPTYSVSPSGWSNSKTVTITYPSGYTKEYSIDGGTTWKTYSSALTFTSNGSVIARVNDGLNYVTSSSQSVSNIERTKPTLTISASSGNFKTSGSIKITAADTGGSNLSSSNTYKYCLSTSNTSATGCTWTAYTSGTAFTISATNTTRYLWVYPIKDNAGNINGSYTNITTPYLIGTYKFDSALPTLSISSSQSGTTISVKLTAADTGGSGLSSSNTYKYCLSTSSSSATGCTWTSYTSGTTFSTTGSGTRYLFVYPVKDNSGNVNDSKTFGTPYSIKTFTLCSDLPGYTYTGNHQLINDGNGSWRIKFLSSGTLTITQPACSPRMDVFLVGGGSSGGGGGYTLTKTDVTVTPGTAYSIVVGAGGTPGNNGTASTAFGQTAKPGNGCNGGSGCGGSAYTASGLDGASNGGSNTSKCIQGACGGTGQGTTTREFGEASGALYAGGGGGGGGYNSGDNGDGGRGGSGGGGCGDISPVSGCNHNGAANTGGGAGRGIRGAQSYSGGSGIVILRGVACVGNSVYCYTGKSQYIDDGNGNWRIKLLSSGNLTIYNSQKIDVFLVGGGSSGGGSGYTKTQKGVSITGGQKYSIVVGDGGIPGTDGFASTAFGYTANPGSGCNGGSGCGASGYTWSGYAGGSNGASNTSVCYNGWCGGSGQGTTTREFGESSGTLYAGAGGGGGGYNSGENYSGGAGGSGGGGCGDIAPTSGCNHNGTANTGGGAGLGIRGENKYAGGSGIVVVRNAR